MKKFWNWIRNDAGERVLRMEGPIDEESMWGDEVTPKAFRDELNAEEGDVILWLNSPGGNVFAASEIYTMLRDYKGKVTVKIDSVAASAASVIAMAGDHVAISPTGLIMIHDPSTIAMGTSKDMEHAIEVLGQVKESIINAYAEKSHLSRNRIANLMTNETWLNAKKALDMGFVDEILFKDAENPFAPKKKEDDDDPDEPDEEKDPDEGEGGGDDDDDDEDEKKKKGIQLAGFALEPLMYSTRQMGLTILNRLGVQKPDPVSVALKETTVALETSTVAEHSIRLTDEHGEFRSLKSILDELSEKMDVPPTIGMDGRTADGSMPYEILMNQLDCLKR